MVIGNFASKDFVAFKLAHDGAGVTNDLTSAFFGRFLFFGIAVHEINSMFKSRGGDVVEKSSKSLFFVVRKTPDDEGHTDAVGEDGIIIREVVEVAVLDTINHANTI